MSDAPPDGLTVEQVDAIPGARVAAAPPAAHYVPVATARERLEAAGKWDALVTALASDMPRLIKLLTLRDGLDPTDPDVLGVLYSIDADPASILAP